MEDRCSLQIKVPLTAIFQSLRNQSTTFDRHRTLKPQILRAKQGANGCQFESQLTWPGIEPTDQRFEDLRKSFWTSKMTKTRLTHIGHQLGNKLLTSPQSVVWTEFASRQREREKI